MESFAFGKELKLPKNLRGFLAKVHGKVIQTKDLPSLVRKATRVYAVGDAVVESLLEIGYVPAVAVFDYKIGRMPVASKIISEKYGAPLAAENRRGTISKDLWRALNRANRSKRNVGVRVYGEEDLAAVVCAYIAPKGSMLLYGIPGRGIDSVMVTQHLKAVAMHILLEMKDYSASSSKKRNSFSLHVRKSWSGMPPYAPSKLLR